MERLQKIIANAGICSRRKAEQLILDGKVTVNGQVVNTLGTQASEEDQVEVEGKLLGKEKKVYFILNKPRNTLTTVADDRGRPTVMDIFTNVKERIYPVGRLDFDTTGALILTNDGELTNLITHPSGKVEKVYIATIDEKVSEEALNKIREGIEINGEKTQPATVEVSKYNEEKRRTIIKLTINEGKNHQVKNMFEAVGYEVKKLNRESVGGITTKGLYEGQYRPLTLEEIQLLKRKK